MPRQQHQHQSSQPAIEDILLTVMRTREGQWLNCESHPNAIRVAKLLYKARTRLQHKFEATLPYSEAYPKISALAEITTSFYTSPGGEKSSSAGTWLYVRPATQHPLVAIPDSALGAAPSAQPTTFTEALQAELAALRAAVAALSATNAELTAENAALTQFASDPVQSPIPRTTSVFDDEEVTFDPATGQFSRAPTKSR